jgi:hypothetical protein
MACKCTDAAPLRDRWFLFFEGANTHRPTVATRRQATALHAFSLLSTDEFRYALRPLITQIKTIFVFAVPRRLAGFTKQISLRRVHVQQNRESL